MTWLYRHRSTYGETCSPMSSPDVGAGLCDCPRWEREGCGGEGVAEGTVVSRCTISVRDCRELLSGGEKAINQRSVPLNLSVMAEAEEDDSSSEGGEVCTCCTQTLCL